MKYNKRIAICVPSYGHRYTKFIDNMHTISDEYDKYIFVSDDDERINEYDKYMQHDNVHVITCPAGNLPKKRQCILDFCMVNYYDYCYMIDDDCRFSSKYISEETKRTTSNSYRTVRTDLQPLLDEGVRVMNETNTGHISFCIPWYLGLMKQSNLLSFNTRLNAGQFILLDLKQFKEKNIEYDTTFFCTEDIDLLLKCLISGIECRCINYMTYELCNDNFFKEDKNHSSSVFDNMTARYRTMFGDNYKYNIPIIIDKRGVLHRRIRFDKYFSVNEMPNFKNPSDEILHNMIVEYYDKNGEFDKTITNIVIEYLKREYNKKHPEHFEIS